MPLDAPVVEWTPDTSDFEGGAGEALNVIPTTVKSYGPLKAFAAYSTTPLTARCQGAAYFRATDGTAKVFAADATKLYLLTSATFGDASRLAGGAYAVGAEDFADFAQFGGTIIAVNGTDVPQKFTLDSSTNFSALGGTPPTGPRFIEIMGDFVVMARLPAAKSKVQWSAINNAEDYVASATTQSDSQTIPDGGDIMGMLGYEYGGLIFQRAAIRRMDYEGSPVIFRFKKISDGVGATIEGSVAGFADRAFFCHRSGFYMIVGGSQIIPIGAQKVDQTFWGNSTDAVDTTYLTRISSAVDPVNKIYGILYCGVGTSSGGTPNRLLMFHWDTGRWTHAQPGSLEFLWSGTSQAGVTLEGLDAYSASIDALAISLDSPVWQGTPTPLFSGFDTSHNIGYFNGANLAAMVDTNEIQIFPGAQAMIVRARPMVESSGGATPSLAIGGRNRLQDAPTFSTASAGDTYGFCTFRQNWRYHRGRITLAAGTTWDHVLGIDAVKAVPMGDR